MNYQYTPHPEELLEAIPEYLRDRFPFRVCPDGLETDVEGIIDEFDVRMVVRPWDPGLNIDAYVARDPHVIVVQEGLYPNPRRLRLTLAEELAHKLLEYKLWEDGTLPEGAAPHQLSTLQYEQIESDAQKLAVMLLLPKGPFTQECRKHLRAHSTEVNRDAILRSVRNRLGQQFNAPLAAVQRRMRDLHLITEQEFNRCFVMVA